MARRRALFVLGTCAAAWVGAAKCETAEELLARAERRVAIVDSMNHAFSGTFRQRVFAVSVFGDDSMRIVDSFAVHVQEGMQVSRVSLSGDSLPGVHLPPHSASVFALRDVLFPFRGVSHDSRIDLQVVRLSDTTLGGRRCGVIAFDYHSHADSTRARGAGRLWIALDDGTPQLSAYDLQGRHPRRGDFLSSVTVITSPLGRSAVIARNVTRVAFSLKERDVGQETTEVLNASFHPD